MPDAKTIWLFREHLTQARAIENLLVRFDKHLAKSGYLAMGTSEERDELRYFRRENRQLRQERYPGKALAWLIRSDVTPSRSSSS